MSEQTLGFRESIIKPLHGETAQAAEAPHGRYSIIPRTGYQRGMMDEPTSYQLLYQGQSDPGQHILGEFDSIAAARQAADAHHESA